MRARVELAAAAFDDLERLIFTHSLPPDTKERVARSLRPLATFPLLGAPLEGRWQGFRFLIGPWQWLILVYVYLEDEERVVVVTVQDGRAAGSASGQ